MKKGLEAVKFKIDLHVHSRNSGDNDADPEETVNRAIELGLDGIAFTEHYSFEASEPVERLSEKYRGSIALFRGVEFSAAEGHCLVFGVDTDRLDIRFAPIRDVVRVVTTAGGVVIPTHLYRGGNSMGDLIFSVPGISAVEGYNGANMHTMNVKAIEAAAKMKIPYTGGSDAHEPIEVGSCYTVFDDAVTRENFLSLLKAGRFKGVDTRKISRSMMF
jgi:predicted metal-dependent phosphoesterase TrpH